MTISLSKSPTHTLEVRWVAGEDYIVMIERERFTITHHDVILGHLTAGPSNYHWFERRVTITPGQLAYAALMVGLEDHCRQDPALLAREEAEREADK